MGIGTVRRRSSVRPRLLASVVAGLVTLGACVGGEAGDRRTAAEPGADSQHGPSSVNSSEPAAAVPPRATRSPTARSSRTADEARTPRRRATTSPSTPAGLPTLIRSGPRVQRRVALTFDADMTPVMLRRLQTGEVSSYYNSTLVDELRRRHVPATLFLTGLWMQRYPQITRELAADPLFELGTHTWRHLAFTADCYGLPTVARSDMLEEVTRAQRLLDELAGRRSTRLFRFPGGCYDIGALRAVKPAGVTVVQFDVAGGDGFQPETKPIVRAVLDGARAGSIVVLHMNGANTSPRTQDAIGPIVTGLRRQGYILTTVSGLFGD